MQLIGKGIRNVYLTLWGVEYTGGMGSNIKWEPTVHKERPILSEEKHGIIWGMLTMCEEDTKLCDAEVPVMTKSGLKDKNLEAN